MEQTADVSSQPVKDSSKIQILVRIDSKIGRQFRSCIALRGERISDIFSSVAVNYIKDTESLKTQNKFQ